MSLFTDSLPFTLNVEAGYQDDRSDDGNWTGGEQGSGELIGTNHGISAPVLVKFLKRAATVDDMKSLTEDDATAIYATEFWNAIRGDDLGVGIGLSTFDMQVNSGVEGAKCLQQVIGLNGKDVDGWIGEQSLDALSSVLLPSLASNLSRIPAMALQKAVGAVQDGKVGNKTLDALKNTNINSRPVVICCSLYDKQLSYYKSCKKYPKYGKGWTTRAGSRLDASLKQAQDQ